MRSGFQIARMRFNSPLLRLSSFSFLSALLLAASPAFSDDAKNIVVNGDFEAGIETGWKIVGDSRMVTVESEDSNKFARIQPKDPAYCLILQRFPVGENWTGLQVAARVRVTDLVKGPESHNTATLLYVFEDAAGQHLGEWNQLMIAKDQDWTEMAGDVKEIPPGATSLVVQCAMMNAAGAADFDNIVVTPSK
jgi:hypothetical protein